MNQYKNITKTKDRHEQNERQQKRRLLTDEQRDYNYREDTTTRQLLKNHNTHNYRQTEEQERKTETFSR
jgi:hypothetical protein